MTDDDDQATGWEFEAFKKDYLARRCSLTLLTPVHAPGGTIKIDEARCLENLPDNRTSTGHDPALRREAKNTPTEEGITAPKKPLPRQPRWTADDERALDRAFQRAEAPERSYTPKAHNTSPGKRLVPLCAQADRAAEATPPRNEAVEAAKLARNAAEPSHEEPAARRGGAETDSDHDTEPGPSVEEHFRGMLAIKKMSGDGNCLFHALGENTGESGACLRALIIQYLRENAEAEEDEEQVQAWLQESQYLQSDPGHWGGDTAIIAFTRMRQQRVLLHWRTPNGDILTSERTHSDVDEAAQRGPHAAPNATEVIHLWYNGRDHYDLLVPIDRAPPPAPPLPPPPPPPPPPHPIPRPAKRRRTAAGGEEAHQQAQARKTPSKPATRPPEPEAQDEPNLLEELTSMPVAPDSSHPRRKLEEALRHLAHTQLRAQPLIPPGARPEDLDRGEPWPGQFCAFQSCNWSLLTGTEQELREHVQQEHATALQSVAQHLPKPIPADALASVYNEAIALRCREAAPVAGSSRDRSALRSFAEATSKDRVEAIICFCCACIHTRVADAEAAGPIRWRRLIQGPPSNDRTHAETTERLHDILSIDKYLGLYGDLAGDVKLTDVAELNEWTVTIPGLGDILCCPEDHRCHANPQHPSQHTLCEHCEVPLCRDCAQHLDNGQLPPLSLCNDMWTGYSPARLHAEKVTVMEMICASPCVTTLVCMSMEARHRSEGTTLDEKAQNARHRLGARGNALTFPLPWEDLLRNLEAHHAEVAREQDQAGAAAPPSLPRTGKALAEVARVLLKTNKTGKTSETEIKTLLHQATVRRDVVVNLIHDMQRLGHPAFQHLRMADVREAASQLPEGGVPPEVLKIISGLSEDDETAHKLQPQKAAAPTDAPEQDMQRAGAIFADQRARAVVPEGCSTDREDQNAVATAALNDLQTQLRSNEENEKVLETMEVRTGNILVDQFQPLYFATAFSFCFAHGTACPDVQNSNSTAGNRASAQGRRRDKNPEAPQVQIFEWATAMQRRAETQFRRDWSFGFTLWNYLFRTMVNTQGNAFIYSVADENHESRALTTKEILEGQKQIQQKLLRGQYLDINNQLKPINGDLTKLRFVPGLSEAALKARSSCKENPIKHGPTRSASLPSFAA
ncbi:anks1b [Symbiodinium sp. CCMP2592]|nr:anks1b [Symbiodinium sp. CCMP2592]